jgi:uncharacterized protein
MKSDRLLVTGASGLVGQLLARRTAITPLPRGRPASGSGPCWEPRAGVVHADGEPIAAVIHLAGASIGGGLWTARRKAAIRSSRVDGTRTLVRWIRERRQKPAVLVCASAVGFYGDRGEEGLTEDSAPGEGFLAEVCRAWEHEALQAEEAGVRVVRARFGVVLSRDGGALRAMEPVFKLAMGGPLGNGKQWFPWIHGDDLADAILWLAADEKHAGAYNLVAPDAVRQGDFARALGEIMHRPALLPVPGFVLRTAPGSMGQEMLLTSQHVAPARLMREGFVFRCPTLAAALSDLYRGRVAG